MEDLTHIICFSGGEDSAIVGIEVARKYGKENVILLNHNIATSKEDPDIKRFKKQVADYIGLPITYANIQNITDPSKLPDQFDVCVEAGALTDFKTQNALCTHRLKTEPFFNYLARYFITADNLFEKKRDCLIYYGFSNKETARIQRRSSILGAMGYKTDYVLALWKDRTIFSTREIGIEPPTTYLIWEHANCVGCLKASLLHWYCVFCTRMDVWVKAVWMELELDFTIHTVVRNGIKSAIPLSDLESIFERMELEGIPATEHQSKHKFAAILKKYQLEELDSNKPCECLI